jgi:hypothetical protein
MVGMEGGSAIHPINSVVLCFLDPMAHGDEEGKNSMERRYDDDDVDEEEDYWNGENGD